MALNNSAARKVVEPAGPAATLSSPGFAFAIPINQASRVAAEIIDTGRARRTVIGAQLDLSYEGPSGGARSSR